MVYFLKIFKEIVRKLRKNCKKLLKECWKNLGNYREEVEKHYWGNTSKKLLETFEEMLILQNDFVYIFGISFKFTKFVPNIGKFSEKLRPTFWNNSEKIVEKHPSNLKWFILPRLWKNFEQIFVRKYKGIFPNFRKNIANAS